MKAMKPNDRDEQQNAMNRQMKQLVKLILGQRLFRVAVKLNTVVADRQGCRSYSQEGEDRVLASLLLKIRGGTSMSDGFYVDVGAHHPYRYSNTCFFYKRGWRGINIDAMPGSMTKFRKQRPRDINVESGIGRAGTSKFYVFNAPALNTFDEELAKARSNGRWRITQTLDVPRVPLSEVLKQHLPENQAIDFLTVDVEGFDLDVLQSNDWQRYRPSVVLVETLGRSLDDLALDPVTGYMRSLGYVAYSKTVNTTFFVDDALAKQPGVLSSENRLVDRGPPASGAMT
jgi:FkbM family methyltransferase